MAARKRGEREAYGFEITEHGTLDWENGVVPNGVQMTVSRVQGSHSENWHLMREEARELMNAIHARLHPYAGASIGELMLRELDDVYERIMESNDGDKGLDALKAEARGMSRCIAIILKPLSPDWTEVRSIAGDRFNRNNERGQQ